MASEAARAGVREEAGEASAGPGRAVRLGDVSDSRDNNFNLIRIVAAAAVLVSHAWPLSLGGAAEEPLEHLLGRSLGFTSVAVFFAISGFLIARSYARAAGFADWAAARVLRLFPGLAVVLALTALVLGPVATALPLESYFAAPGTAAYWPRNMSLAFLQYPLPGVFEDNPYGPAINGSLWSLQYEVACYMGVLVLGLAGALKPGRVALLAVLAYLAFRLGVWGAEEAGLRLSGKLVTLAALSLPFALGTALYVWRDRVPLTWTIALALAALAAAVRVGEGAPGPLFEPVFMAALTYWTFCLAYLPGGRVRGYNRLGDYSYGVYIYAFPVQQSMVWLLGPMTPWQNIALAAPVTLVLAILSWRLIERPALRFKNVFRPRPAL